MPKIIPFPEDPIPDNVPPFPQRDLELLKNIGIHIDHAEAFFQGKPFGAEVVNLGETKNKR